jgi:hypothetical protein
MIQSMNVSLRVAGGVAMTPTLLPLHVAGGACVTGALR